MEISIPVLTLTAFANGLNPCGIGLIITFLGYLMVFGGKNNTKSGIYKIGSAYILSVFVTYLVFGLMFYGVVYYLQRMWIAGVFKYIIGGLIVLTGLIQIKDVFWQDLPIHLRMPKKAYEKLGKLMARASVGMAVLIGFLTTVFATPCMMPLYIGTTAVIAKSGLSIITILGLFLYYNFVFVLPLVGILVVMAEGKKVVDMKEWEHKNTAWMRFILGLVLLLVGVFIIYK